MSNTTENRSQSSSPVRILAAAVFMVMMGTGYAVSTQVEARDDSSVAIPAVVSAEAAPFFPAQFPSQPGGAAEEHIQAF